LKASSLGTHYTSEQSDLFIQNKKYRDYLNVLEARKRIR